MSTSTTQKRTRDGCPGHVEGPGPKLPDVRRTRTASRGRTRRRAGRRRRPRRAGCSRSSRASGSRWTSRSRTGGSRASATYDGAEIVDARGEYVVPGFIDAHMHIESSKLLPDEFARLVLPLGTTAVVADPHEIANVLGTDGVHWLLDASAGFRSTSTSWRRRASPRRASSRRGAPLGEGDLEALLRRRRVIGLAEMMNFPGVVAGDAAELAKLALRDACRRPRARGARPRPAGVRGGGDPLRPRGLDRRGGARAAPGGDVAAHPGGVGRAEPARAPAACRTSTARTGSRSAPTTASPSTSRRTATSTRSSATRSRSGSRRRTRS